MNWVVHKFGGSSLASAEHYRRVAGILAGRGERKQAIVVSAMQGVTDDLLRCARTAAAGGPCQEAVEAIGARNAQCAAELGGNVSLDVSREISEIDCLLGATRLRRRADRTLSEQVSGYGEIWSARILAGHLASRGAVFVDAREVLTVERGEMGPEVDWERSKAQLDSLLEKQPADVLVITGYIASDPDGCPTTLGRNGSDYSAAIFARLLGASDLHIWTDVGGVLSADPRLVPDAQVIDELSYDEALELAYFGAKVIHPQTLAPAIESAIPIHIRNSLEPEGTSTRISNRGSSRYPIKGITAISNLALINVEGAGMIGVPGTARRVFGALKRAAVSVVMISQGSSEHSICFVVSGEDADRARASLLDEFEDELRHGFVQAVSCNADISILAVVGDQMAGRPGIASRFFSALADAGINVRAIAQGSSERNISAVIDAADANRAVRAVHASFYLSRQTLSIGLLGVGNIGRELLAQIDKQAPRLRDAVGVDLRVRAMANSRQMSLQEVAVDLNNPQAALEAGSALDMNALTDHVQADHLPHAALIDCTASDAVAAEHGKWLARGIHVITANKKSCAGPLDRYQEIAEARRGSGARFYYETTVGAGLPVIETLRDLRRTGDRIRSIEGMFSGTLAYLFNRFDGSMAFSDLVRQAWKEGYTEPDPREDLSGLDVARKLVILAREVGIDADVAKVNCSSLVPASLADCSADDFVAGLADYDESMRQKLQAAQEREQVLRYVGRIGSDGTFEAGLTEVSRDHAFANGRLTDNVIAFRTDRYSDNPLVVQGPGAGTEVTAGGVFADILRLCTSLGARW